MTKQYFMGTYNHTLDAKGRVSVPSRFRDILSSSYRSQAVVLIKRDGCITVFPYEEWVKFSEEIQELSQTRRKVRNYRRVIFSGAVETEIDRSGRAKIPDFLIKELRIEKDLILIGVQTYFEIWSKASWENFMHENSEDFEDISDGKFKLFNMGGGKG